MQSGKVRYFANAGRWSGGPHASTRTRIILFFGTRECRERPIGLAREVGFMPLRRQLVGVFRLTIIGEKTVGRLPRKTVPQDVEAGRSMTSDRDQFISDAGRERLRR